MTKLPHYTKVLNLGSAYTENALVGEVVLQEKVDGSQFRFGITEEDKLLIGSKNSLIYDGNIVVGGGMFKPAMDYLLSIEQKITEIGTDVYFFGEYLKNPKHNTLKYNTIPKNHIVLFDVLHRGTWIGREDLEEMAQKLEIDVIPEFYMGKVTVEDIKKYLERESYLGGEKIEGVVIKNYKQTVLLGGKYYPLFTKYVNKKFKERNGVEWKANSSKNNIEEYIKSFRNENRWKKAYQYLRDNGKLKNDYSDIGTIIKRVQEDIKEEETENIKKFFYNRFIKEILRNSTKGLPEWFKELLLNKIKGIK